MNFLDDKDELKDIQNNILYLKFHLILYNIFFHLDKFQNILYVYYYALQKMDIDFHNLKHIFLH